MYLSESIPPNIRLVNVVHSADCMQFLVSALDREEGMLRSWHMTTYGTFTAGPSFNESILQGCL